MRDYKFHTLNDTQGISFIMGATALSKDNKRIIKKIAQEYPDPLQPAINWEDYVKAIGNIKEISDYASHLNRFIKDYSFTNLQNIKPDYSDSDFNAVQDYRHLADYAGFLFICLFSKWNDTDVEIKNDADQRKQAFEEYYKTRKVRKNLQENPYIKIDSALRNIITSQGTLYIALPAVTINELVVRRYDKQPMPFEQEGSQLLEYILTIENRTMTRILNKKLSPFIETYQSPFTRCELIRWVKNIAKEKNNIKTKIHLPLNEEWFAGGLYAYAAQHCTDNQEKWLEPIIKVIAHFNTMNGYDIAENTVKKQINEFIRLRKAPNRKEYNNLSFQNVYGNSVNHYYTLFYNAFRQWKLDLLYRQSTIKTEYYVKIESAQEFKKAIDLIIKG